MIAKIAIAKPVTVVHNKGDKMPVYLDEVDAVEDFIKQKIKENADICIDTSHFATFFFYFIIWHFIPLTTEIPLLNI